MASDQSVFDQLAGTQPGFALWLTGLPAAGKSTLAQIIQRQLAASGVHTLILDSDELRQILTPKPTYSDEERDWFYSVLVQLAVWLTRNGINVLIAATAQRRAYRQAAREQISRFAEVYLRCSLERCQQRDPKGIYALGQTGQAAHVPGLDSPFEPPLQPEAVVDTEQSLPAAAAASVLAQLASFLPPNANK